uniref:BTD domain-containing protein n=1 Tax=Panagrellus redivivus TaxID=6233 RepID=A0A7E4V0N5_PANRE
MTIKTGVKRVAGPLRSDAGWLLRGSDSCDMAAHALYEPPVVKRSRHTNNGYLQNSMPSYDHHQQQHQNQMGQYSNMQQMSVPYDSSYMYSNMQSAQEYDAFSDPNMNTQHSGYNQNSMYDMSQSVPMNSNGSMPMSSTQMNHQPIHGQSHYPDPNLPSTSEQMPQQSMPMMSQSNYPVQMSQSSMMNPMPVQSVSSEMAMYQQNGQMQQQPQAIHPMHDQFQKGYPEAPNHQTQQQMAPALIQDPQYDMNMLPDYGIQPIVQFHASYEVTPHTMQCFLADIDFYTCSMTIHVPKAAQKSYKTEKRFVVPPPTVMLEGKGWSKAFFADGLRNEKSLTATMWVSGVSNTEKELDKTQLDGNKLLLTAKSMYISTDEKKKMISLTTEIKLDKTFSLGPVTSERMKVMSKPSKKKQTAVGPEARYLSITSKSRIALYNRLRSQNISTRFFYVKENGKVEASPNQWSVLEILLIRSFSDTNTPIPSFELMQKGVGIESKDGNINYGDIVALADVATGIALPPMRIRKTLKTGNAYHTKEETSGEPVSQLHMVVFEFLDEPQTYLHANPEFLKGCSGAVTHDGAISVNDGCRWTIISAEATTHKFAPLLGRPKRPVAPMPVAWEAEDAGMQLNDIEKRALPINLVRDDGVVYTTEFVFEYNIKSTGCIGRLLHVDDLIYEKSSY